MLEAGVPFCFVSSTVNMRSEMAAKMAAKFGEEQCTYN